MHRKELIIRIIGVVGSLALTMAAYLLIVHPDFFHLGTKEVITFIVILAILQLVTQFLCFIDLWREKQTRWNLGVFVSTLSIIIVIIVGSIWIMHHLNYNMMP